MPNLPMSFVPQAGGGNSFNSNGCVVNKNGIALLVDDNKQVFQLSSANVSKMVGKRASVKGTIDSSATPQQGATQVVNVSSISNGPRGGQSCTQLASSIGATTSAAGLAGAAAAGAAVGGTAGAAAAGAGGAAAGSTAAVVGGVAAAAAGVGVATGVSASNSGNSSPQ
jgi:hypothetical protein